MKAKMSFTVNGETVTLETDGSRALLWVLRSDLGLTGSKYGCGVGMCGSCTILVDGVPTRACLADLNHVEGKEVTTIEGLGEPGELHPLQQEFYERGAYQCGYCTPGMIMNAYGMLQENSDPTREEIIRGMDGNLCRCSAYKRILEAIESYAGSRSDRGAKGDGHE